ncbi:hypothetical protein ACJZ2D_003062 [Fusarium nematophilum]
MMCSCTWLENCPQIKWLVWGEAADTSPQNIALFCFTRLLASQQTHIQHKQAPRITSLLSPIPVATMPLQLRNARPDDIPAMRNVYYSAFGDTVIANRVFLSNREAADRFLAASFADELVDSHCQLLVVTSKATPDSVEEEVVAFAKWGLPGATIDDPPPVDAWPASGELAVEFFGTMARGHRKFMGSRQHYYLECICTHRDWMGKGAGSLLVRWGVERADADGLLCFLEATVKGKPVYERFGFQTVGEEVFRWPERTVVEAYMERQPSAAASVNGQ